MSARQDARTVSPAISTCSADELLSLSGEALDAAVRRMSEGEAIHAVEALRGIAARHYHSDAATARRIAQRALEVAERAGRSPLALGWGHRAMAEAHLFSGRMREAESSYARAASAFRSARAPALLGQLLVGRIHVLSLLGRHAAAEGAAKEARRCLEAAGDDAYLAKLAMNLGNMRFQLDRYAPALEAYERAASIFRRLRVRDETVIGLEVNRGVALTQLDHDEEALALFRRLERECARRESSLLLAQVRMNAAYLHSLRAEFDVALRDLAKATSYFSETDHRAFSAACYLNHAEIYHQLNLHREACDLTDRAAPLFASEGMAYDSSLAIAQGALSSMALGETARAIRKLKKARAIFEREKSEARLAVVDLLLAEALLRRFPRRPPEEAVRRAADALATFRSLGLVRWEAAAAVLLSGTDRSAASARGEIRRLRSILRRMTGALYPVAASRILERIGGAQERIGRTAAAARSYRDAISRLEDIRSRIPSEDSKISFLQDKSHLYDRLLAIEVATAHPSTERIFETMERSRAQSLWDRIRSPASYLGAEESDPDDPLRRRISWLHARISRLELGTPEQRAQAMRLRRELEDAEEKWSRSHREGAEAALAAPRRRPGGIPSCEDVARALPDGWGFLSYHLSRDFGIVLAITRAGSAWRSLRRDTGRRVRALADRLDFQWSAAAMASVARAGVMLPGTTDTARREPEIEDEKEGLLRLSTDEILLDLGNLLLRPVREMVGGELNWIVSPHGPIHRVPFHALGDRARSLVDGSDVLLVPSARIWYGLPERRGARARRALIVGLPSPELPGVEAEVDLVCRRLAGWEIERDLAPTRDSLRSRARRADLLHIATHGALRGDNPAYSWIDVADGPLFVHDLARFRLPGSTVVLTACSSGGAASPGGDEWIGLARGFLQAGASTVVASLWPVDDATTLELMDLAYAELARGKRMAPSLSSAMRACKSRHPHPWRWGPFAVLGKG